MTTIHFNSYNEGLGINRRTILLTICLLMSLLLPAQDFTVTPLPTWRLLPTANIHCLMQDSEGYFWYGTDEGGLCRDNGYQIDVLRPQKSSEGLSLGGYHVSCIAEDAVGNILFGTANGLFVVKKDNYMVENIPLKHQSNTYVEALFTDSKGCTWIGLKGTIMERMPDGTVSMVNKCMIDGKPASVASFHEDNAGRLFVLQWGGGMLCRRRDETVFAPLNWPLSATPLQMIDDERGYWVLTSGAGVVHMTLNAGRPVLTPQPATTGYHGLDHGLSLLRDSLSGLFWVTTIDNLYAYTMGKDGQLRPYSLNGYLPDGNKILDQLMESRDGDIYVAGFTPHTFIISPARQGLTCLRADAIRRLTGFPVLADRAVYESSSLVWVWQGRKGLLLYDREKDEVHTAPRKYDRTIQRCMEGGVWSSDRGTLYRVWQDGGKVREEKVARTADGEHICCLFESDRQTLLVATNKSLYRLAMVGRQLQHIATLPEAPTDLCADGQGNIFLSLGKGGLFHVAPKGQGRRVDQLTEVFRSVCCDTDGSVCAATFEGNVYRYTLADRKLNSVPLLCGTNPIKSIRADGLGHIWTLTDQQVCEYASESQAFRTFHNEDPFIDVSYFYALENIDATHVGINGAGALIEITSSTELSRQTAASAVPRLSAAIVHGQTLLMGREQTLLSLDANDDAITLQLTTLDHRHAANICFAYRLEGINREWIYLPQGSNTIVLSNLPKGSHALMIKGTDRYGCWSQPTRVITIQRAAHWYENWWAYLIYTCFAILAAYIVWRLERRIHLLRHLIKRKKGIRLDEIEMKREDIDALKRDDSVLRLATSKIEEHLSDSGYNVQALGDDLCMSRVTLYRRIQELTGMTPTDFIRDIRLKKAAHLLIQSPKATTRDIAFKVGFADPKNFSRRFKEKFGMLPTEYRKTPPATA